MVPRRVLLPHRGSLTKLSAAAGAFEKMLRRAIRALGATVVPQRAAAPVGISRMVIMNPQQQRALSSGDGLEDRDVEVKKSEKQMVALLRRIADSVCERVPVRASVHTVNETLRRIFVYVCTYAHAHDAGRGKCVPVQCVLMLRE